MLMNLIRILAAQNSGFSIGLTGATNGATGSILDGLQIQYSYLDIENLKGYTADKSVIQDQNVLIFDDDEPGMVKTKKISFDKVLAERLDSILVTSTLNKVKPSGNIFNLNVSITGSNEINVTRPASDFIIDLIKVDGGTY